ncbi:MAG: hypothetical protein NT075_31165 [Chloroflexi bacterium]|nr:hypothetical protein [Chloroflexota bacterium]
MWLPAFVSQSLHFEQPAGIDTWLEEKNVASIDHTMLATLSKDIFRQG